MMETMLNPEEDYFELIQKQTFIPLIPKRSLESNSKREKEIVSIPRYLKRAMENRGIVRIRKEMAKAIRAGWDRKEILEQMDAVMVRISLAEYKKGQAGS